jgi:hypothetical protein
MTDQLCNLRATTRRLRACVAPLAAAAVGTMLPSLAARADDPPANPPAKPHCVWLQRIDHTETLGDRNILFYLKDGTIYRNELPNACPTLRQNTPFMYRLALDQLCDTDVITVLQQWNFGFTPTVSCLLGPFHLIDRAQADALKAEKTKSNAGG